MREDEIEGASACDDFGYYLDECEARVSDNLNRLVRSWDRRIDKLRIRAGKRRMNGDIDNAISIDGRANELAKCHAQLRDLITSNDQNHLTEKETHK